MSLSPYSGFGQGRMPGLHLCGQRGHMDPTVQAYRPRSWHTRLGTWGRPTGKDFLHQCEVPVRERGCHRDGYVERRRRRMVPRRTSLGQFRRATKTSVLGGEPRRWDVCVRLSGLGTRRVSKCREFLGPRRPVPFICFLFFWIEHGVSWLWVRKQKRVRRFYGLQGYCQLGHTFYTRNLAMVERLLGIVLDRAASPFPE
jgi:hypothetical protein